MTVPALLDELRRQDIHVWAEGERLRCNAPVGVLSSELRARLLEQKKDILSFLHAATAIASEQKAIVPLQARGTQVPVFAVPGHNGDVFCYRTLVRYLGEDQPFYGLEPPGVDGQREPLTSVEDLASYFVDQIRTFHTGRCIIAGFCAGGSIAFEVARRLLNDRMTIDFIALFAAPYPTSYRYLPQLGKRLRSDMTCAVHRGRALLADSWTARRDYLVRRLRAGKPPADSSAASDPALMLRARIETATLTAARQYSPQRFAGRVALFLPCREWVGTCGAKPLGWHRVAHTTEEWFGPSGCEGTSMLLDPYARDFARLFTECRERSGLMPERGA